MNRTTWKISFQIEYSYHPTSTCELRELKPHEEMSGHAYYFSQSMRELHEQVKRILDEATQKLKSKMDANRKDVQFEVGDWVLVHLNKARLIKGIPTKLQMRRIGPCKVLAKYGSSAYKIDIPQDLEIYPIFNVKYLIQYKGLAIKEGHQEIEFKEDTKEVSIPTKSKPQDERFLDSRVKKKTSHVIYMEHNIKQKNQLEFHKCGKVERLTLRRSSLTYEDSPKIS